MRRISSTSLSAVFAIVSFVSGSPLLADVPICHDECKEVCVDRGRDPAAQGKRPTESRTDCMVTTRVCKQVCEKNPPPPYCHDVCVRQDATDRCIATKRVCGDGPPEL